MARPVARNLVQTSNAYNYTLATGYNPTPTTNNSQQSPYPVNNPVQLMGVDAVVVNLSAGTTTVTFPNLPIRNNLTNPLSPLAVSSSPLTIDPQDKLLFFAFSQGALVPIAVSPQALAKSAAQPLPGPFLGGNTYLTFQAVVNTSTSVSATIVGMLFIQRG